jgi:hypothetical protein
MPKLPANIGAEADKAASEDGPAPVPAGQYVGKLLEVKVSDKPGPSGSHYWTWEYQVMDDGYTGKKLRHITSLSEKARFSVGGAFAAFGVPSDTDTDELIGQRVLLVVSQTPIQSGPREGQLSNRVDYTLPYNPETDGSPLDEDF